MAERKIFLAKNAGFCMGVKSAVDKALELKGKCQVLGDIIHNETVIADLKSKGVNCVNDVLSLDKNKTVLIRTHGAKKETIQHLSALGFKIEDCTCPFVKKIHEVLNEKTSNGYFALIIGYSGHDETEASLSYCNGKGVILSDFSDIEKFLNTAAFDKLAVVAQTTFDNIKYENIVEKIKNWSKGSVKTVEFFNTICYTTFDRQKEAVSLATQCDAVAVVGSRSSANTTALYRLAKQVNPNTFFISGLNDLSFDINQFRSIAVLAGASTPTGLLLEVINAMSETQKTAQNAENTTVTEKEATSQASKSPKKVKNEDEKLTMAQIVDNKELLNMTDYKPGKRVKCTVMSADDNGITISLGGKKDGFISKEEACYEGEYNPADFKPGSEIEAVILSNTHDSVLLSKKKIDAKRIEDEEAEKALKADVFTLEMTEVVKGGLRGRMGSYTVFVPASHITTKYVSNLEDYKGKKLRLVVMPPKAKEGQAENTEEAQDKPQKKSKYIFASQRLVLEREKKEKEDAFWESIHVHDIVEGKVKRFTEFGAFVSVRGFDCLCHISEISWNKITDPSTVLKAGETYDFVVLKMDREANKISLGYKQLQKKPYEEAAEKYPVGTVIKGKVERIFPYGAFVSIDNGVDGLVHVSQIAHQYIKDANEVLTVGQEVEAKIIGFEGNRITLSIKALLPEPEVREEGGAEEKKAKKTDGDKKEKKAKKTEKTDELREWHSDNSSATLGDLFKAFDLGIEEEAPAAPKKTRKKASTEEAPAEETPSDDKKD